MEALRPLRQMEADCMAFLNYYEDAANTLEYATALAHLKGRLMTNESELKLAMKDLRTESPGSRGTLSAPDLLPS